MWQEQIQERLEWMHSPTVTPEGKSTHWDGEHPKHGWEPTSTHLEEVAQEGSVGLPVSYIWAPNLGVQIYPTSKP